MSIQELSIWCVFFGALLPLVLSCAVEVAFGRARWASEALVFIVSAALYVFVLSGMAGYFYGSSMPGLIGMAPGLVAPVSVVIGLYGARNWLGTKKRESFADISLQVAMGLNVLAAVLVLVFDPKLPVMPALHAASLLQPSTWVQAFALSVSFLGSVVGALACARVAVHGDKRAWQMLGVSASTAVLNVVLLLRAILQLQVPLWVIVLAVALYVPGVMLLIRASWKRGRTFVHASRALDADSGKDPITRLPMGSAMVSEMDRAYNRSLMLDHRPVLVMVRLFNSDDIVKDCGQNGLNQVVLATLARIRKVVSPADMVGRYYASCFVVQINGRVTSQYLRGLGLRLAASVRRPVVPRLPPSGFEDDEPIETDIGVGICWCNTLDDLTMALHEAEEASVAARGLRSRAAVKLSPDDEPQAVEKVLGESRLRPSFVQSATARAKRLPKRLTSSLLPKTSKAASTSTGARRASRRTNK